MIPVPLERLYKRSKRLRREADGLIKQAEAVERSIEIHERHMAQRQAGSDAREAWLADEPTRPGFREYDAEAETPS